MKAQNASIIYLDDDLENEDNQHDFRLIVRPRVVIEMQDNSSPDAEVDPADFWAPSCSASEAREIAQALIEAALVV